MPPCPSHLLYVISSLDYTVRTLGGSYNPYTAPSFPSSSAREKNRPDPMPQNTTHAQQG